MKSLQACFFVFSFFCFFSCTLKEDGNLLKEDETEKELLPEVEELIDIEIDIAKYSNLGYGYDFLHSNGDTPLGVKSRVIDIKRLVSGKGVDPTTGEAKQFQPLGIEIAAINGQKQREVFGVDFSEFQKKLNLSASVKFTYPGISFLSIQISSEYDKNLSVKQKYSFHQMKVNQILKRIYFENLSPDRLKYFLTDEFRTSLQTSTAEDFLASYGTHVLTDINIGGQLTMYTTAEVKSNNKNSFYKFSTDLFGGVVAGSIKNSSVDKKETKNISVKFFTTGGSVSSVTRNIIDADGNIDPDAFDFKEWIEGVNEQSSVLIGMNEEAKAIEILDFVYDQNKKDQLLAAMRKRSEDNVVSPTDPIPVDMLIIWETGKVTEKKTNGSLDTKTVKESYLVFRPSIFNSDFDLSEIEFRGVLTAKVQAKNKDGKAVGDYVEIKDEIQGFSKERFVKHPRNILSNNGQPLLASVNLKNMTEYQQINEKYGFYVKDLTLTFYLGDEVCSYNVNPKLLGSKINYKYDHNNEKLTGVSFDKLKPASGKVVIY